eukprot:TRINITY_DN33341_c0_g1_i1.p1 TRINITY_DN33341_c0_g1~~TRINITY_DN33341_c0_g1_i1.p1  ORF type:complete len:146 (+),score=10.96 TRINITY_DN33341_c0_g1_i1:54-440(+)
MVPALQNSVYNINDVEYDANAEKADADNHDEPLIVVEDEMVTKGQEQLCSKSALRNEDPEDDEAYLGVCGDDRPRGIVARRPPNKKYSFIKIFVWSVIIGSVWFFYNVWRGVSRVGRRERIEKNLGLI